MGAAFAEKLGRSQKGALYVLALQKEKHSLAKKLRREATPQENHLWYDFLAHYSVRFQRQKAIGDFIADFYCHQAKLVIEIDGSQHFTESGIKSDNFRTEKLEAYDLTVIRFDNHQINTEFTAVCDYIDYVVKEALAGRPFHG